MKQVNVHLKGCWYLRSTKIKIRDGLLTSPQRESRSVGENTAYLKWVMKRLADSEF